MIHPKPSDKNFPEQKNEICYNHVKKITVSVKNLRHILDRHKISNRNTSSPLAIAFAPFGPNPFQLMFSVSIVSLLPTIKLKHKLNFNFDRMEYTRVYSKGLS